MLVVHCALTRVSCVVVLLMVLLAMMLLVAGMMKFVMIVHLHVALLVADPVHHVL